jgi:uncharacterized Zn ribbon protein
MKRALLLLKDLTVKGAPITLRRGKGKASISLLTNKKLSVELKSNKDRVLNSGFLKKA